MQSQDRRYEYSGYEGVDGHFGQEFVQIRGDTNTVLAMKAFGYAAGNATVTYTYFEPPPPESVTGLQVS
jgi:hypothetical protein